MASNKKDRAQGLGKIFQIAGLGLSLNVALISGPLIGFFLGKYLVRAGILSASLLFIPIVIGLIVSIFNTVIIVRMMARLSKDQDR